MARAQSHPTRPRLLTARTAIWVPAGSAGSVADGPVTVTWVRSGSAAGPYATVYD